ncbi:MAG: NifB/NifX family molybdenum-iron cluster-binding protein [Syntrophomonadaceae bacterium]|nr:NifB/NifX family molybdenum-iron cluster-binding protein [Syntrophomonadaceae bacterium]
MKIVLPVGDNSIETKVCSSFGRAPYLLIYDIESQTSSYVSNHAAISQGGAGIKAAQIVADTDVSALLTPRCGDNAARVFAAAGIKIYKTINDSVKDNIAAFSQGKLTLLTDIHPGFHGQGGK